jgi:hypothetical protein
MSVWDNFQWWVEIGLLYEIRQGSLLPIYFVVVAIGLFAKWVIVAHQFESKKSIS